MAEWQITVQVFLCFVFLALFVGIPYLAMHCSEANDLREEAVKRGYASFSDKHEFQWKNEAK